MRNALLSLGLIAGLTGLHCSSAQADASPPCVAGAARCAAASPHIEVVDEGARPLPAFEHLGRTFVLGDSGSRYFLHVVNPIGARVEAVVSVDGIDVVDGRPAGWSKRGYIIPAYGDLTIEGFRTSLDAVAAFRFSSVCDSYAARTGHARNVGVIGVAFFRERAPSPLPVGSRRASPTPAAAPASHGVLDAPGDEPANADRAASGAPAASGPARKSAGAAAEMRPGLGTQFGEAAESHVVETSFVRAGARPFAVDEVRYDDREGLVSRGIDVAPHREPRDEESD